MDCFGYPEGECSSSNRHLEDAVVAAPPSRTDSLADDILNKPAVYQCRLARLTANTPYVIHSLCTQLRGLVGCGRVLSNDCAAHVLDGPEMRGPRKDEGKMSGQEELYQRLVCFSFLSFCHVNVQDEPCTSLQSFPQRSLAYKPCANTSELSYCKLTFATTAEDNAADIALWFTDVQNQRCVLR